MKKILHIQLLPFLSGVQNVMLQILDSLAADEYEIHVAACPGGPLVDQVISSGWFFHPLPLFTRGISIRRDFLTYRQLLKLIKQEQFDIVHTHSSKPGILGRFAASSTHVPLIVHTVHGYAFHPYMHPLKYQLFMQLEKLSSPHCDKIVFVNNAERELAIDKKLASVSQAVTIFNGIEADCQSLLPISLPLTIGSACRFDQQKNMLLTIQAAIMACHATGDINFCFLGDGRDYEACVRLVNTHGLGERISLPGWQADAAQEFKKFDVFLLNSLWEGLPLSILEAMAVGLPIIASDIKGNNELVVHNKTGLLVSPLDKNALAGILAQLPARIAELNKWSLNSLDRAKNVFSLQKFIQGYKNIYEYRD